MNNSYSHSREDQDRYPDEISLVDLAVTFIRRRHVFYVVFLLCTLGGLTYAFFAPDKYEYEYVSLVQVAQKAAVASGQNDELPIATLQSPAVTIATLQASWLPQVKERYYADNKKSIPFGVVFENPEGTTLIRLSTVTGVQQDLDVQEVHAALIQELAQYQNNLVEREQASINQRIDSLEALKTTLMRQANSGLALSTATEQELELKGALRSLVNVEPIVNARETVVKSGPKRNLIVAVSTLTGFLLGILMVFMFEFGVSVKKKLAVTEGL
ncbi:Wzz/FepE/Etk N-terminal domain-containing protein [Marinobacter psychrophilus]|uniref:Wzz/FepE/Etk N-terminal domain-containing protein n=1 Tax=Marinobacter psychrophilus TaxID=330734 RepID=UPI001B7B594C|nr:Wzz/FepE/Etk N-terminal domain-containing protein [Marinobacter psychrophilus]MBQ0764456.1 lipopolysaccharide biosynthesis protein [Marinobacter psychrophilus]MBQ0846307.1 lipopolysaccharide biosynthesis protein [Marinobacter psychrophilus]